MAELPQPPNNQNSDDSLESLEFSGDQASDSAQPVDSDQTTGNDAQNTSSGSNTPQKPSGPNRLKDLLKHVNIYLLMFVFILLIAGAVILIAFLQSKHTSNVKNSNISSQNLTQAALNQVANSDASVGSSSQVLNVQSNAVFAGQVLIRSDLEVAGNVQLGGTLSLSDLSVAGTGQFGNAAISSNLSAGGNAAIQGSETVGKTLQVNGGGNFGSNVSAPQITTSNLQLTGDLVLTHHIDAGGATPSRSNGSALGSGGTASVGGSDTAGSISINTGGGPSAGCFATINFASGFNATPHVIVTPVGAAAGGLSWYINRSASNFSICDATTPPANASFGFDYFVVD